MNAANFIRIAKWGGFFFASVLLLFYLSGCSSDNPQIYTETANAEAAGAEDATLGKASGIKAVGIARAVAYRPEIDPDIMARARFIIKKSNMLVVKVVVKNADPGPHATEFHEGPCNNHKGVIYTFNDVVADDTGMGSSVTILQLSAAEVDALLNGKQCFKVHEFGAHGDHDHGDRGNGIARGDVKWKVYDE